MFDPDSDDASRLPLAESGVDRDVKIEQLLLPGLEHSEADLLRSAVQRALLAGSGEPADEVGVDRVPGER